MSFTGKLSDATKGKHGHAVILAAMVGLIVSDIIPTPADALYFHTEKKLRDKWAKGQITPQKYWQQSAAAYYVYNPVWWGLVLGATFLVKGDYEKKLKVGLGLIGVGAVVGVIYKNFHADLKQVRSDANNEIYPPPAFLNASGPVKKAMEKKRNKGVTKGFLIKNKYV